MVQATDLFKPLYFKSYNKASKLKAVLNQEAC